MHIFKGFCVGGSKVLYWPYSTENAPGVLYCKYTVALQTPISKSS